MPARARTGASFSENVTGDRFSRRENLMEKSEVSDTDAPTIRQAIHGSAFSRVLLFAEARRGDAGKGRDAGRARGRARPGVRYTPEVTFVYRRTIAAAYATHVVAPPRSLEESRRASPTRIPAEPRRAEPSPKYSAASYTHRRAARSRVNPG